MADLVSVVMPLYNAEKTIAETIESVLDQTYTNWELNIVDDCSTDGSAEIVKKYEQKDSRIKYYRLEKNSGAAVARNTSMEKANGKYLAFLDSDDLWHKDKLEKQIQFMKEHNVAYSFTEYDMFSNNGEIIKKRVKSKNKVSFWGLVSGTPIMCSSVVIDRNIIGNFKMPLIRSGQDYATWAIILKNRAKYAYNVKEILAHYRKQESSLSSNKMKALKRTWYINRNILGINLISAVLVIFIYSIKWIIKHYF